MPLQISCNSCGAAFKVREDLVGKKVRCPKCKEPVLVTAAKQLKAPAEPPRRSRSKENDREEQLPSSRKRNLLIGAGVGGALLIAVIVVVVVNSRDDKDTKPPTPVVDVRKDQSAKDADKKDADWKDRKDRKDADKKDRKDADKKDKKDGDKKEDREKIEPFKVARWQLQPDPGADMSKAKDAAAQAEFFKKGMGAFISSGRILPAPSRWPSTTGGIASIHRPASSRMRTRARSCSGCPTTADGSFMAERSSTGKRNR